MTATLETVTDLDKAEPGSLSLACLQAMILSTPERLPEMLHTASRHRLPLAAHRLWEMLLPRLDAVVATHKDRPKTANMLSMHAAMQTVFHAAAIREEWPLLLQAFASQTVIAEFSLGRPLALAVTHAPKSVRETLMAMATQDIRRAALLAAIGSNDAKAFDYLRAHPDGEIDERLLLEVMTCYAKGLSPEMLDAVITHTTAENLGAAIWASLGLRVAGVRHNPATTNRLLAAYRRNTCMDEFLIESLSAAATDAELRQAMPSLAAVMNDVEITSAISALVATGNLSAADNVLPYLSAPMRTAALQMPDLKALIRHPNGAAHYDEMVLRACAGKEPAHDDEPAQI